ncbi:MAG: hypothetical protein FJ126_14185 [Deltaproteobacteria bacterium]|nr:hypothetical protein [Deltaproteobacteria bacterium]
MDNTNQTLCPIPDMGYCLYERCPYWDQERQECDAACYQDAKGQFIESDSSSGDFPCTITWTEEID